MLRLKPDRLLTAGGALFAAGAAGVVGYGVYALQGPAAFWRWPGYASVVVLALGVLLMVGSFFFPDPDFNAGQVQQGGPGSTNLQARHDIRIDGRRPPRRG
jgi:hypothetical protein